MNTSSRSPVSPAKDAVPLGGTRRLSLPGPRRDVGVDPDYRFSLANERTFLAWIRTALALVAGGLAASQFLPEMSVPFARDVIGVLLVMLGLVLAAATFHRWTRSEEAMRLQQQLPASRLPFVLAAGVVIISVSVLALLAVGVVVAQ